MLLVCSIYVSVMCMYCVIFELRRKSPKSPKRPKRRGSIYNQVSLRKRTLDMVMDDNLEHYHESLCLLFYFVGLRLIPFNKTVTNY